MKSKILMSLLVIVVSISMMASVTLAWFTDTDTSTGNTFTAGTLSIDVNGNGDSGVFDILTVSNMAPGDVTPVATLVIKNSGSLPIGMFRQFKMEGSSDFAEKLQVTTLNVTDFSNPDGIELTTHSSWSAWDVDKDGFVTLYDLDQRTQEWGNGWDLLGMEPDSTQTIKIGFTLMTSAGNDLQGLYATLKMNIVGTQKTAGGIQGAIDQGLLPGINAAKVNNMANIIENHLGRH